VKFKVSRAILISGLSLGVLACPAWASGLDAWLGLDRLSLSDESTQWQWAHPLPAWIWALIVCVALLLSVWSYTHLLGTRWVRLLLAAMRAVLLVVIAILLAGPELVRVDERIERDWVMVMVDRSRSLTTRDLVDFNTGQAQSREQQLSQALTQYQAVFDERGLADGREVRWLLFDQSVRAIASPWQESEESSQQTEVDLGQPVGAGTRLGAAFEQALSLSAGRPVSGMIVLSDGRLTEPVSEALVERLQRRNIGVYVVPLGAKHRPYDLAIDSLRFPREAFIRDRVPVTVRLSESGGDESSNESGAVTIRLIDAQDEVLDETTVTDLQQTYELVGRGDDTGPSGWRVEVSRQSQATNELVTTNNTKDVDTVLIDRAIRVLYVEGYPRWEYRYLKNLLLREASVELSTYLFSADRAFAQEGDIPITRLPETLEELEPYDVLIIGDVQGRVLSPSQAQLIRDHVAARGAGLLWLAGRYQVPWSYEATSLSELLPMVSIGSVRTEVSTGGAYRMMPTSLAQSLGVMRLTEMDGQPIDWNDLSGVYWMQSLGPLKPGVEVLAELNPISELESLASENNSALASSTPSVVRMRFGAGQVLYTGVDGTWRWRFGRGERLFEQYWIQWVRLLAQGRVGQMQQPSTLEVSSKEIARGDTLVVELDSRDPSLIARDLATLEVSVVELTTSSNADANQANNVNGSQEIARLLLTRTTDREEAQRTGRVRYRGQWLAGSPATVQIQLIDPVLASTTSPMEVQVLANDVESLELAADHEILASLAQATQGEVVAIDQLENLLAQIPSRPRLTPVEIRESVWDSWAAFVIVLGLLFLEWIGRKLIRLV